MNIASNEDSGLDFTLRYIGNDEYKVHVRYNHDDTPDVDIHYILPRKDLEYLFRYIQQFVGE